MTKQKIQKIRYKYSVIKKTIKLNKEINAFLLASIFPKRIKSHGLIEYIGVQNR